MYLSDAVSDIIGVWKNNRFLVSITSGLKALFIPLISTIVSVFVSVFFIMWAKNISVLNYFDALKELFKIIFNGCFGSYSKILETLVYVTPLIFTGLANIIAFRCGLFNIGVEGQFIVGMIGATLVGMIPGLSPYVHVPLIILSGFVFGAIWAGIPGYFKASHGTNEVVTTLMMNFIAQYLGNWISLRSPLAQAARSSTINIQKSAQLLRFDPSISRANISIILAILCAVLVYFLLWKTTVGYEIRAVGFNPDGANYGGINIFKNTVLVMGISGAVAGIGGATHLSGIQLQLQSMAAQPGYGFDGIAVALLAVNNPIGCIASAFLFGALRASSRIFQVNNIPKEIVYLIQSVIIVFVASDYIFKYFSDKKRKKVMKNG